MARMQYFRIFRCFYKPFNDSLVAFGKGIYGNFLIYRFLSNYT